MAPRQRERVLALLRETADPVDAHRLAEQLNIHVTTVRFHLAGLADDGLIRRSTLPATRVGRPRVGYVAVVEPSYADLVALLAAHLGGTAAVRERRAEAVGREWAGRIPAPLPTVGAIDAATLVADCLARLGFRVQSTTSIFGTHTLTLCTCPLAETARHNPEVVRGMQRGLIQGVLDASAPRLGARYLVNVVPDPDGGNCRIGLVLHPAPHTEPATASTR